MINSVDASLRRIYENHNVVGVIHCDNHTPSSYDLYNTIKQHHRDTFSNNEKIIFVVSKDYYSNESAGLMLQSIQRMVNKIDISNFFVHVLTTNPNANDEYRWVLENISTDSVPIKIEIVPGEFQQVTDHTENKFYAFDVNHSDFNFSNLTEKHKHLLFQSKTFCMLPWVAMDVDVDSKTSVCCHSTETLGDCSEQSLNDIWNSSKLKQMRLDMLENKSISACQYCYNLEDKFNRRETPRKESLRDFAHLISRVDSMEPDGTLPSVDPAWLSMNFSNLCNLSCRMCSPKKSTSWHLPGVNIGIVSEGSKSLLQAGKGKIDIVSQVVDRLDDIQRLSFSGGEPLMSEEIYIILEELISRNKHDVEIYFNTNLTTPRLKKRSIFDIWKKLPNTVVAVSLDGEGRRNEYLRPGASWDDILQFRKEMLEKTPHIRTEIKPAVSIVNALHIPDFHKSWVEQGLSDPHLWVLQYVTFPHYLSIRTAPEYLRRLIKEKYLKHLEWLRPLDPWGKAVAGFESILTAIENPQPFDAKLFWEEIGKLDRYYNVDLLEVFPELQNLPRE